MLDKRSFLILRRYKNTKLNVHSIIDKNRNVHIGGCRGNATPLQHLAFGGSFITSVALVNIISLTNSRRVCFAGRLCSREVQFVGKLGLCTLPTTSLASLLEKMLETREVLQLDFKVVKTTCSHEHQKEK